MTQIKSESAKGYIDKSFMSECNDVERYLVHYGEDGVVLEKGRIGRCRRYADKAVILAETELTESHAKELQELKDKVVEAFCKGMCDERECRANNGKCTIFKLFTQKLNEK